MLNDLYQQRDNFIHETVKFFLGGDRYNVQLTKQFQFLRTAYTDDVFVNRFASMDGQNENGIAKIALNEQGKFLRALTALYRNFYSSVVMPIQDSDSPESEENVMERIRHFKENSHAGILNAALLSLSAGSPAKYLKFLDSQKAIDDPCLVDDIRSYANIDALTEGLHSSLEDVHPQNLRFQFPENYKMLYEFVKQNFGHKARWGDIAFDLDYQMPEFALYDRNLSVKIANDLRDLFYKNGIFTVFDDIKNPSKGGKAFKLISARTECPYVFVVKQDENLAIPKIYFRDDNNFLVIPEDHYDKLGQYFRILIFTNLMKSLSKRDTGNGVFGGFFIDDDFYSKIARIEYDVLHDLTEGQSELIPPEDIVDEGQKSKINLAVKKHTGLSLEQIVEPFKNPAYSHNKF